MDGRRLDASGPPGWPSAVAGLDWWMMWVNYLGKSAMALRAESGLRADSDVGIMS